MRAVRGKETTPEIVVRSALHRMGFRFRTYHKGLPGSPDIVLPRWKTVIFIHGCFWHRHDGCRYASMPKHNSEYWTRKFEENIQRDRRIEEEILRMGWRCLVIWECELKKNDDDAVQRLADGIKGNSHHLRQ